MNRMIDPETQRPAARRSGRTCGHAADSNCTPQRASRLIPIALTHRSLRRVRLDRPVDAPTELGRPLARGGSVCHVLAVRDGVGTMVAACGRSCGGFGGHQPFNPAVTTCEVHHEPVCRECVEILEHERETGLWIGPGSDPHHGTPRTVCLRPGCPELVLIASCWCDEHLAMCRARETPCQHPAHLCDAAVHFCDQHGGPAGPA